MKYCEQDIISRIILDDQEAFRAVYERYGKRLYLTVLRLVKTEEVAEELVQDVFVKVWENRRNLNPTLSFKAYLFKIAENHVLDSFRKAAREKNLKEQLLMQAHYSHNRTEESLLYQEYEWLANQAIDLLPPQRKRIFELCRLEGHSYDQISEGMRISKSTVSDHMVKAIKFIRKYLHIHGDIVLFLLLASN
jgi:RNA polymerase sigma-70 factor (family 1)